MKILFLLSSLQGGGAERVATRLANAWAERGDEVILIPTFSGGGDCAYPLSGAVQLRFLSDMVGPRPSKLLRLRALRQTMRTEGPDVVVSFLSNVNVSAILAATGLGIPVIASERVYPPLARETLPASYHVLRRLTYPFATALVGQSEPAADWLRRCGGRAKTAVIPNSIPLPLAVNDPVLPPASIVTSQRKVLLWAGRFADQKRPDLMVKAFARVAGALPEWDLVMLGDGSLRKVTEAVASHAGIADRVRLPGFAGNLANWYERASIFVLTSSFEGFPNTLLEAMAHGVPSIAFDVLTGPRELSDGARRLVLLPDDDQVASLSAAIAELASDPSRQAALGEAAREVANAYSDESVLAMWDDLFAACLASRS